MRRRREASLASRILLSNSWLCFPSHRALRSLACRRFYQLDPRLDACVFRSNTVCTVLTFITLLCLYKLSYLIRFSLSLSLSLCGRGGILFPQMASPCGRGDLWPPTTWYRFAYSLSSAIPSLPPSLGTSPSCKPSAIGVGLRPT